MQDSLPAGGLRLCRAGVEPAGSQRKVSVHVIPLSRAYPVASWIHAERLYRTLPVWSDASREAVDEVRCGIWRTYRLLRACCRRPSARRRAVVKRSFARTFQAGTGYRLLDEQIGRTLANRDKLLAVLDRPDVPAHTNATENDLRGCVVRRKISGGTRSDTGRACRTPSTPT